MTLRPLDNRAWGFDSDCFVCEPANERGLRIPFFHDEEAGTVVAECTLDKAFSGPPSYVHGGVLLAVLDEAMAWATIALHGVFALTRTTTASFTRPVRVGRPHRVEARVVGRTAGGDLRVEAVIRDGRGRACVEARAEFVPLTDRRAEGAIGRVEGDDTGYLRAPGG